MFSFGSSKVDFLPEEESRTWIAEGLRDHAVALGEPARTPRLIHEAPRPGDFDQLFEVICGVQAEVGQADVEFTLLEMGSDQPDIPKGFEPLGDPRGQLMHTFARGEEYLVVVVPQILRQAQLLFGSIARELGRIGVHRVGGHRVDPEAFEADAELAAVALGLGVWVANGAYVYENACCGGGCGIDLSSIRAGLSMPEAVFALALDGHRKGLGRRVVAKQLEDTQRAALKRSWSFVDKQPSLTAALSAGPSRAALGGT